MMASAVLREKISRKTRWKGFTQILGTTLICTSLLAVPRHPAQGQSVSATVTEILDSNQVYIQNRTAQVSSVAQQNQQVRTQSARTALQFNNGAVARLAHNSSLVVGQCAQVNRGTLLVNGPLNGCSTSTVAGVRGTIYTIEVTEDGQTIIQVFEGEVVVQRNLSPEPVEPALDELDPVDPNPDWVNPDEPPPAELSPEQDPTVEPLLNTPKSSDSKPEPLGGFLPSETGERVALKQDTPAPIEGSDSAPDSPAGPLPEETVDFTPTDSISVAEGQQITVDAEKNQAVITLLTAEDFIELLEGPLINGFVVEIPGISNLRGTFERLFPGIPLPSYWVPPIPIPPIRLPFPF